MPRTLPRYLQTRLTPLPLECLQLVFRTIADGRDSNTLTALLRCNSYFFEATVPFLYGDPLDLLLEYSSQPLHQKTSQLLTLLLFCTSVELQSELLQARFDLRFPLNRIQAPLRTIPPATRPKLTTKYLAHLRHFQILRPRPVGNPSVLAFVFLQEYLSYTRLVQLVKDHKLIDRLPKAFKLETRWELVGDKRGLLYMNFALQKEITLAICCPILEQIRTLTIPFSDIALYHKSIHRLQSLQEVVFLLDELLARTNTNIVRQKAILFGYGWDVFDHRKAFEPMGEFAQDHVALHKNVLRKVKCPRHETLDQESAILR